MKTYYTVYKTTNLINQKIYIGVHKTTNLNDGYYGSGTTLKNSIIKYGINNFNKEILFNFDNSEEMFAKEKELVTKEFIKETSNYNMKEGGTGGFDYINENLECPNIGFVVTVDQNENIYRVSINDKKYLSGELVSISKDIVVAKDKDGNTIRVTKTEFSERTDLVGIAKGIKISEDGRKNISNGHKGFVPVKDSEGNHFNVSIDDPRYLSGELIHNKTDIPRTEEVKNKISETKKGVKQQIVTCPHCKKEGGISNMKRHHFDNCKLKIV